MRSLTFNDRTRVLRYLAWGAFVLLALAFADSPISAWVRSHKFAHATKLLFRVARLPGDFVFTFLVVGAIVLALRRGWRDVVAVLLVGVIASLAMTVVKLACARHRPSAGEGAFAWHLLGDRARADFLPQNLSFPSGDTTLAFATATVLATVVPRGRFAAFGWASAVGIVRVCQGVHFPSDVLAGALIGTLTADCAIRFAPQHFPRWDRPIESSKEPRANRPSRATTAAQADETGAHHDARRLADNRSSPLTDPR